jgi:hypothetical protein
MAANPSRIAAQQSFVATPLVEARRELGISYHRGAWPSAPSTSLGAKRPRSLRPSTQSTLPRSTSFISSTTLLAVKAEHKAAMCRSPICRFRQQSVPNQLFACTVGAPSACNSGASELSTASNNGATAATIETAFGPGDPGCADIPGYSPARADWLKDDDDGLRGKASADDNYFAWQQHITIKPIRTRSRAD